MKNAPVPRGTLGAAEQGPLGQPLPRPPIAPLVLPSDRLVDDTAACLAKMPALTRDWTTEQERQAVQSLMTLLEARAGMVSPTRAKADALLGANLPLLLKTVDGNASPAQKQAIVDVALQKFADSGVPFASKEAELDQLMKQRELFRHQLREPGAQGRAPAALRKHAVPLLATYRQELLRLHAADQQPDDANWDSLVLPLVIEAQNARTPGLDVKLLTQDDLLDRVEDLQHETSECIGILDFGPESSLGRQHHSAFYATTAPDRPPRITILDSIEDPTWGLLLTANWVPEGTQIVPVKLQVQNAYDCVVYCTTIAKKIADHRDAVNGLPTESDKGAAGKIDKLISGTDVLPLAFFKHSQSRSTLERLAEAGKRSGRHDARTDAVNKDDKTIFERWDQHRVERPSLKNPLETATYSASIEAKRLLFINQALEHFG